MTSGVWKNGVNGSQHVTHGMKNHPLYYVYRGMISRCYNEKSAGYKNYGGRGIEVYKDWIEDRTTFFDWAISGYAEGLTLERIDVNGNYDPSNCTWATKERQCANRRITIRMPDGTAAWDVAKANGIKRGTFLVRIYKYGWSIEKAAITKARGYASLL